MKKLKMHSPKSDSVKENVEQIFKELSQHTELRTI